nr:uncharacterized protein LOC109173649 [Ipomoea trifida]GMD12329.1 uncharacterized protein LOC109173649 [Ipomoea batatas]
MGYCGGGGPRGAGMEDRLGITPPDPSAIAEECWASAEEMIRELVNCIHPTMDSEEKRKDVMEYIQKLIRDSLACEVFPYGSVPLKTYLPDGDIDLTALTAPNTEEFLVHDVLALLREEEKKENVEYEVKDTQFIDAEVKLVKCLVQDIVIDLSFNQLGGLCSLCFLEQVDRLVGKNHLFKHSIMLIKSWCYYESRILGSHHGLISTYALETLILYIFQFFHSSLNGPLAVLYRFLDYYSRFDWEKYCISLNGPVCKASLPEIVVSIPDNGGNLLLSEEFLRNCMEMFSAPSRVIGNTRVFKQKHLNIIDPLNETNNLGRSVHRGNYYRIRSAFKYGARKLGRILLSSPDKIGDGITKFFANTIDRHGHNRFYNLKHSSLKFCPNGSGVLSSPCPAEFISEDEMPLNSSFGYCENDNFEWEDKCGSVLRNEANKLMKTVSECSSLTIGATVSGHGLSGDTDEPACPHALNPSSANSMSNCSTSGNCSDSLSGLDYSAPEFNSLKSCAVNGSCKNWAVFQSGQFDYVYGKPGFASWIDQGEYPLENSSIYQSVTDYSESVCSGDSATSTPKTSILESLSLDFRERDLASIAGDLEVLNPLADLTGDYDSHIRSLIYGQCCHGYAFMASLLFDPSPQSHFQNKVFCNAVQQSSTLGQNSVAKTNISTVIVRPFVSSPTNHSPSTVTCSKEKPKAPLPEPFVPNMDHSFRERPWKMKGRNKEFGSDVQFHNGTNGNGWVPVLSEANCLENDGSQEFSHAQPSCKKRGKFSTPNQYDHHPAGDSDENGLSNLLCGIEFGSLGKIPEDFLSGSSRDCSPTTLSDKAPSAKPELCRKERFADQSFHLKNEDEFPPLPM